MWTIELAIILVDYYRLYYNNWRCTNRIVLLWTVAYLCYRIRAHKPIDRPLKWKTSNFTSEFNGYEIIYSPLCLIFRQDSIGVKSYVCFCVQSIDRIEALTNVSEQLGSTIDEHSKHFIALPEYKLSCKLHIFIMSETDEKI